MAKVTEAQAKTLWCPFTRVYAYQVPQTAAAEREQLMAPPATGGPANRYINATTTELNPDACRCIASQCMAWAWIGPAPVDPTTRIGYCGMMYDRS